MDVSCLRNMGFILILVALLFSWILVVYRYILKVDEKKVNTGYLLKAHIDFLLMGILLILFSFLGGKISSYLILFTCIGTATNPTLFIVLAFNPSIDKSPKSILGLTTTISYLITTIGIGGICLTYLFT